MYIVYFPVFLMCKKVPAGNVLTSLPVHDAANKLSLPALFLCKDCFRKLLRENLYLCSSSSIHCKVSDIPVSQAGMSLTKLSLAGNN